MNNSNNNNEAPKKGSKTKKILKGILVVGGIGAAYALGANVCGSRDKLASGIKTSRKWIKGFLTKSETTAVAHQQETVGCTYTQPQYEQQPAQRNFERREDRRDQRREFNNNSYKH